MHEGFSITVTAKYNNSLGDDTLRANEQDLLDPMIYEVEASNQMFDVPLTDFFDDYIDEYTQEFLLEACYKETCTATFVFIEDNDSEYYGGFINPRCACAARVSCPVLCRLTLGAHAQRGLVVLYCVDMSVCPYHLFSLVVVSGILHYKKDTSDLRATNSIFKKAFPMFCS